MKTAHLREQEKYTSAAVMKNDDLPLLLEAWKPISMGYKKRSILTLYLIIWYLGTKFLIRLQNVVCSNIVQ